MNRRQCSFISTGVYILMLWLFIGRAHTLVALTASDTFNRANKSPIAGNWTTGYFSTATILLASNQIINPSGIDSAAYWNSGAFANDQFSQSNNYHYHYPGQPCASGENEYKR